MSIAARAAAGPLLGRSSEVELLTALLDGIDAAGSTLVLHGEPGIGKSRLLAEAARLARDRAIGVLRTSGVQAEAHLAFAGLHQLVRPIRERAANLPAPHRAALDAAFGIADDAPPEPFRIAMAALDLLSDVAAETPLLVTVDDAHRLDHPSADVLAFVARRIESDRIVLLVAARDGHHSPLTEAGLPEQSLGALDPATATALLEASGPQLTPAVRSRLLREAAGNPLALVELPQAGHPAALAGDRLPLTDRLEQAFAARVADLPEPTRWLLLVAAVDDEDHLDEVLRAGSLAAEAELDADHLQPAADAAIVELDVHSVRFRHPLMRSAVLQGATPQHRRRVHEALAATLRDQPDRAIWHRAGLLSGVHEDVAAELQAAGERTRRRGAADVAAAAARRAAELSGPTTRTARLLAAAGLAFELGQGDTVTTLLDEVQRARPGPLDQARATYLELMIDPRPLENEERTRALLARPSRPATPATATSASICSGSSPCARRGPTRGPRSAGRSWRPRPASATRAPRTRGSSPPTPTRMPSGTLPAWSPASRRRPRSAGATRSGRVTSVPRRSSSAHTTSRCHSSAPGSRGCAPRDASGTSRAR